MDQAVASETPTEMKPDAGRVSTTADDLRAAGYKPFREGMKEGAFYEGSWQKRIDDERGKRYFISVSMWNFPEHRYSAQAECQFHELDDMNGDFCNVSHSMGAGIPAMEEFFAKMWEKMGFGYYEIFDYVHPTPQSGNG